jgi:hypothetical protein
MAVCGEKERQAIRPEFDRSIIIRCQGAKITSMIEWHHGELFPRIGFLVTNFMLPAERMLKV